MIKGWLPSLFPVDKNLWTEVCPPHTPLLQPFVLEHHIKPGVCWTPTHCESLKCKKAGDGERLAVPGIAARRPASSPSPLPRVGPLQTTPRGGTAGSLPWGPTFLAKPAVQEDKKRGQAWGVDWTKTLLSSGGMGVSWWNNDLTPKGGMVWRKNVKNDRVEQVEWWNVGFSIKWNVAQRKGREVDWVGWNEIAEFELECSGLEREENWGSLWPRG